MSWIEKLQGQINSNQAVSEKSETRSNDELLEDLTNYDQTKCLAVAQQMPKGFTKTLCEIASRDMSRHVLEHLKKKSAQAA